METKINLTLINYEIVALKLIMLSKLPKFVPNSGINSARACSVVCSGYFSVASSQLVTSASPKASTKVVLIFSGFLHRFARCAKLFSDAFPVATCCSKLCVSASVNPCRAWNAYKIISH